MGIRVYKPVTPGARKSSVDTFDDITQKKPFKKLCKKRKKYAGRNNYGRITVRHKGGGVKRTYRMVDFKLDKYDVPSKVKTIEYDPNRNARIALVVYKDGEKRYILAYDGIKVGDELLISKENIEIKNGNRTALKNIPSGIYVHNIELFPKRGAKLVRSAGCRVQVMGTEGKYTLLKMPSKEIRKFPKDCMATIGIVSNTDYRLIRWGKAGRSRKKGIRPTVLGKSMNPVDHPHGGGEGHSPIGLVTPKTPWGKRARGVKTRKAKKQSNKLIVKRRK
jgi:large subunit ribosomal protein L2